MDDAQDDQRELERTPLALVGFSDKQEAEWVRELVELSGYIAAAIEDPLVLPSLIRTERPDLIVVELAMIFPGISTTLGKVRALNPDMTAVVVLPDDMIDPSARRDIAMALGFDVEMGRPLTPAILTEVLRGLEVKGGSR